MDVKLYVLCMTVSALTLIVHSTSTQIAQLRKRRGTTMHLGWTMHRSSKKLSEQLQDDKGRRKCEMMAVM